MKSRWLPIGLGLLAGTALTAALYAQQAGTRPADGRDPRPPQRRPADPGPRSAGERAIGPLNHSYDQITFATMWLNSSHAKLSKEDAGVLDRSKDLYRKALTAYRAGQYRQAEATALAAHDAARGVLHVLQANTPAVDGLPVPPLEANVGAPPPPPPGREPRPAPRDTSATPRREPITPPPPRDRPPPPAGAREREGGRRDGANMVRDAIREVREELPEAAAGSPRGSGQSFVSDARRALDQAQKASDDGHNRRAIQYVMAAEAWSHVPEHLQRAQGSARSIGPRQPETRVPLPGVRRDTVRPPTERDR